MSALANLTGLLLKTTDRVSGEDEEFHGWLRNAGEDYRLSAYRQGVGRWNLKLVRIASHSGKATEVFEQSGVQR